MTFSWTFFFNWSMEVFFPFFSFLYLKISMNIKVPNWDLNFHFFASESHLHDLISHAIHFRWAGLGWIGWTNNHHQDHRLFDQFKSTSQFSCSQITTRTSHRSDDHFFLSLSAVSSPQSGSARTGRRGSCTRPSSPRGKTILENEMLYTYV